MFGILEAVKVPQEGVYSSYDELFDVLNERMEKEGYKIVKERSHRSRIGGALIPGNDIIRCDLVCHRGGRPYKSSATKHKTSTKKTDCPWKAKAVNRKSAGGWVLTVVCDQHNHEPGTPEPPTPPEANDLEDDQIDEPDDVPRPDQDTSAALQVAGVSEAALRLTGDTFNQFKAEYRKISQADRLQLLSHFQLRIAAIYAVQNEDMQRQRRQEAQDKRHRDVDSNRRQSSGSHSNKRRRQNNNPDDDAEASQLHQQLQSEGTTLGQTLMADHAFQLDQQDSHATLPMGNMFMPQFQQYSGPPKRSRGQRPSTSSQNASHN